MNKDKELFLSAQKDAKVQDPEEKDIFSVGTIGSVIQLLRLPDGTVKVLVEGKKRARIVEYLSQKDLFLVRVEEVEEFEVKSSESEALLRSIQNSFEHFARLNRKIPQDMVISISSIEDPGKLVDTIEGSDAAASSIIVVAADHSTPDFFLWQDWSEAPGPQPGSCIKLGSCLDAADCRNQPLPSDDCDGNWTCPDHTCVWDCN